MSETTIEEKPQTLKESIENAVEAEKAQISDENGVKSDKSELSDESSKSKDTEKAKPSEDLESLQGRELMQALRDPQKSLAVLKFFADQYASISKPETKADVQEVKDDVYEALKAELGDEFDIISKRLAPAIDKIVNAKLEKSQADIRAELQRQESEKLQSQSAVALNKLGIDYFGENTEIPKNVLEGMSKLMDKLPPDPSMSVAEYTKVVFNATIGELGIVKVNKNKEERINKNRIDAPSRLASDRNLVGTPVSQISKKISSREAIRLALESIEKQGD